MKKILLIMLVFTAVITSQTLRQVLAPSYSAQTTVQFTDNNTGWSAGISETIYKTTNGGLSWDLLHEDRVSGISYKTLHFFDNNTGLVGGGKTNVSTLKKTTDGGSTWTDITIPVNNPIITISFIDQMRGWILTSSSSAGEIIKTTDGGNSWSSVFQASSDEMLDLSMHSSGKGVAVGGSVGELYYTVDGDNWTKSPTPALGGFTYTRSDIRSVNMVNENIVYTCGWGSYIGAQPSIFLKSTDGGATWNYLTQAPENRVYQNLYDLYFKDADNGLAFGGGSYEGSLVVRTTDGGINWIPVPSGLGFSLQGCYGDGDNVWMVGNGGGIAFSSNFGTTWELKTPVPSHTLHNLAVFGNDIISAGFNGYVAKSTDKGLTWKSIYAAVGRVCNTINGIHFLDANIGFAARSNSFITKTTDGGLTWTALSKDTSDTFPSNEEVYFHDENNGFVVGRIASGSDAIYKTTDGGINWSLQKNQVSEDLKAVDFFDENHGIVVANDSKILYTADGGTIWTSATLTNVSTDIDIRDVTFTSANNAVAVGESSVFLTTDAGATWEQLNPGFPVTYDGVAFLDENTGWVVGGKYIIKTTDGGKTWADVRDTLVTGSNSLYGITIDGNGDLWISGGSSSLFTTSPLVGVDEDTQTPQTFALFQNYPNPFNPETSIRYSIASQSKVTLRIYDILGKLVTELLNDQKEAGEYKINFNAADLSSGIYLVVMNADGRVFTNKMTLIK